MQEMRNPRGEVSGACTDTLNCHPGDVDRERESFARTWSRIPHNICISFPDTWAQFVRRGSARQRHRAKGQPEEGRDTGTGIVRAFNAELATEMPSLSLRGVHNYIDSLPHPLDAPLYNSPLPGTNF